MSAQAYQLPGVRARPTAIPPCCRFNYGAVAEPPEPQGLSFYLGSLQVVTIFNQIYNEARYAHAWTCFRTSR